MAETECVQLFPHVQFNNLAGKRAELSSASRSIALLE